MAINNFLRLRDAKPPVEEGLRPPMMPRPKKMPITKQGPPQMPGMLAGLLKSKSKESSFYGD